MSTLSEICNAETNSSIPGLLLSRVALAAIGEVERKLQDHYIASAVQSTRASGLDILAPVTDTAEKQIVWEKPLFCRLVQSGYGRQVATLASARVRDPKVTRETVIAATEAVDVDVVRDAVDWCFSWDRTTVVAASLKAGPQPWRPNRRDWRDSNPAVDWTGIFRRLKEKVPGLTAFEFGAMTPAQVKNELGTKDAKPDQRAIQFGFLDRLADHWGLSPYGLSTMPPSAIATVIGDWSGGQVPESMIAVKLAAWLAERGDESES